MHRIFLVDDHAVIREGLKGLIETESDLSVCGMAGGVAEALDLIPPNHPDVVVLDLSLPDGSGLQVLRQIRAQGLKMRVIIFSNRHASAYGPLARREGAQGYVEKHDNPSAIIDAIHEVADGGTHF